ncbi:MAG TPA: hypothetical protein VME41_06350 [Stellaceae bacterium]|nr:hypothetical protein [Stellaceae bacterium]
MLRKRRYLALAAAFLVGGSLSALAQTTGASLGGVGADQIGNGLVGTPGAGVYNGDRTTRAHNGYPARTHGGHGTTGSSLGAGAGGR